MLMKVWLDSSEGQSGIQSKRNHTSLEKITQKLEEMKGWIKSKIENSKKKINCKQHWKSSRKVI